MFALAGVRHLPAPQHGFVAGHDHGVAVHASVLDLPVKGGDFEETGLESPMWLSGAARGKQSRFQFFTVMASESTAFFPVTPSNPASTPL
jgi:hypothetical protein